MNSTHLLYSAKNALVATALIFALGMFSFFTFEPSVGRTASGDYVNFTVTQQITNEISFLVNATNVGMTGSIAGITGGYATGTTVTSVRTNNAAGYRMTLHFATTTAPGSPAMIASSTAYINNYSTDVTGTPDISWIDPTSGTPAEFGYNVRGTTPGEVATAFMNNTSSCGIGTNETNDTCWMSPSTTPKVVINSSAPSLSSTTTLKFKVAVPSNPSPSLPSGYYVATGTLTIFTN